MTNAGTWQNGKRTVSGTWEYYWPGDFFRISLSTKDRVTGMRREFRVYDDAPEWGGWKLVRPRGQADHSPLSDSLTNGGSS